MGEETAGVEDLLRRGEELLQQTSDEGQREELRVMLLRLQSQYSARRVRYRKCALFKRHSGSLRRILNRLKSGCALTSMHVFLFQDQLKVRQFTVSGKSSSFHSFREQTEFSGEVNGSDSNVLLT